MRDADHMLEACGPLSAMVVPIQVLWLLQDDRVPLVHRHQSRQVVARLDDAPQSLLVPSTCQAVVKPYALGRVLAELLGIPTQCPPQTRRDTIGSSARVQPRWPD